jgi:ABC-type lipoprotein release transport system permease subunit
MILLLKLAWRNVLRNKRRTVLSGIAVGICLASLIFVDALFIGMTESMIVMATDTFLGQGQIHAQGFRSAMEAEKTINGAEKILKGLKNENDVSDFAPRTIAFGMISSAANVNAVMLNGIDPTLEQNLSKLDEAIREGSYLKPDGKRQILIGSKLAETLEVGLDDKVVITVAQADTGELSQEMFRVSGIFHYGIREVDGGAAYINLGKSQELLGLGNRIHEIALRFRSIEIAGDRSLKFWADYSKNSNEALGWKDIVPQLENIIELTDFSTFISLALIFAIVAIIIMNTLFMSLYERMFEFGVLRAIGTRPYKMASIIILEAASISIISIIIGAFTGALFTGYYSIHGIDYTGIEFAGVTLRELLYPVFSLSQFTVFPVLIFAFSVIAALYPAVFAAKLTPAKAMQKSL